MKPSKQLKTDLTPCVYTRRIQYFVDPDFLFVTMHESKNPSRALLIYSDRLDTKREPLRNLLTATSGVRRTTHQKSFFFFLLQEITLLVQRRSRSSGTVVGVSLTATRSGALQFFDREFSRIRLPEYCPRFDPTSPVIQNFLAGVP